MRILVDLQGAQTRSRYRGIGRYSMALVQALARIAPQHEIWIALNANFPSPIAELREELGQVIPSSRICIFQVPLFYNFAVENNVWLAHCAELVREAFVQHLAPDVVLVGSLFEGFVDATVSVHRLPDGPPTAVILYDLIPLLKPDLYLGDPRVRGYYMHAVESLRRADRLLAISDASREEGIEGLRVTPDRIRAISTAADPMFRRVEVTEAQRRTLEDKFGLRKPFIFYTGAFEPRKNLRGLVSAYSRLPKEVRGWFDILAVGKHNSWERAHLLEGARAAGVTEDELHLSDYVSDEELVLLYNSCRLFVFPSLHEGFGLPALEAMSCGVPTIGARLTSIPEVIGFDEAMFDPHDDADFTEKLLRGLLDEDYRERLRIHGLEQAGKFTWERTARAALDELEAMASSASPRDVSLPAVERRLLDAIGKVDLHAGAATEDQMAQVAQCFAQNVRTVERASVARTLPWKLRWRVEGPFDSSYSLALLNRETARELHAAGHDVRLWSTEGPGDFAPDPSYLARHPDLAGMYERARVTAPTDAHVTSRNLYPPRVNDMPTGVRMLHHFAWEESGFPMGWARDFNASLTGLTCLSHHVAKVMIDHGVHVPMSVSGCGVDHWERIAPAAAPALTAKQFRFLHVSSCFPRKGADVLLRAWGRAFRASDDVVLVIKTFANPHNLIHEWLADARRDDPDYPDVLILEQDLPEGELKGLYQTCHALVAPSRAEGFGLPIAEAMLSGLPVIATGWGGHRDFCDESNAWLVDYTFDHARTHFSLPGSLWAEPDEAHLAQQLRAVHAAPPEERARRPAAGRSRLLANFTWAQAAARLADCARTWSERPGWREVRVGWVSTWNTRCGIASYSEQLVDRLSLDLHVLAAEREASGERVDEPWVVRCWKSGGVSELPELAREILGRNLNTVVIQFNHYFFWYGQLTTVIRLLKSRGCIVVVTMHATTDPPLDAGRRLELLAPALRECDRVLAHTLADVNRLRAHGVVDNVTLFPLGVALGPPASVPKRPANAPRVIASYGFFLPHKGLRELVEALALLVDQQRNVVLRMVNAEYPADVSAQLIRAVAVLIDELGLTDRVVLHTDFLPDSESQRLLADADLIVFPYQETGESASAAARQGLAVGRPVVVTPIPIFDDLGDAVFRLPGTSSEEIARGLAATLDELDADTGRTRDVRAAAERWRDAYSFDVLAPRLEGMLRALQPHACWRLDVREERFQAQVGRLTAAGRVNDGQAGFLLYGEYQAMPAGRYRATLYGAVGAEVGGWAFFDATILHGEALLARQLLKQPNVSGVIASLEFDLPMPVPDVEFRVRADDGTTLTVSHIIVKPLLGSGLERARSD